MIAGNKFKRKRALPQRQGSFAFVLFFLFSFHRSACGGWALARGVCLEFGGSISADEAQQPGKNDGSESCDEDAEDQTVFADSP